MKFADKVRLRINEANQKREEARVKIDGLFGLENPTDEQIQERTQLRSEIADHTKTLARLAEELIDAEELDREEDSRLQRSAADPNASQTDPNASQTDPNASQTDPNAVNPTGQQNRNAADLGGLVPRPGENAIPSDVQEFRRLASTTSVNRYLTACMDGVRLRGAELELAKADGMDLVKGDHPIPFAAFAPTYADLLERHSADEGLCRRIQRRADVVSAAPASLPSESMGIVERVFAASDTTYLGFQFMDRTNGDAKFYNIDSAMPTDTAKWRERDAEQDAIRYKLNIADLTPRAITAAYEIKDVDLIRLPGLANSAIMDLRGLVPEMLDRAVLVGTGAAGQPSGLISAGGLGVPADVAGAGSFLTYDNAVSRALGGADGRYSRAPGDRRLLVGPETDAALIGTFRGNGDSKPVTQFFTEIAGGYRVSAHLAGTTGAGGNQSGSDMNQAGIRYLSGGTGGPDGVVLVFGMGVYAEFKRDLYSQRKKGVTGFQFDMYADVGIVRSGAYRAFKLRLRTRAA